MDAVHRARERGLESLCDAELLSILLGVKESVAARVIEHHGGLAGMTCSTLSHVAGAERALLRVAASIEIAKRTWRAQSEGEMRIPHAAAVAHWGGFLTALEHEELWVLSLDAKNALRAARRIAMGGLSGLHVGVRDPLRVVVRDAASAFVLVHNHPSGDPTPSEDDVRFTERVVRAADVVGTPLLDHVIVARRGFSSLLDAGLMPQPNRPSCAPA
jgi:DNA repair protein RadC